MSKAVTASFRLTADKFDPDTNKSIQSKQDERDTGQLSVVVAR
jgi:hypothetical protein